MAETRIEPSQHIAVALHESECVAEPFWNKSVKELGMGARLSNMVWCDKHGDHMKVASLIMSSLYLQRLKVH